MTFTVRQLIEKSIEHTKKLYIIFVDIRKAYDSVLCAALWVVLKTLGVPDTLIDVVKSFHEGMEAKIRLDQKLLEEIEVNNGLRKGCIPWHLHYLTCMHLLFRRHGGIRLTTFKELVLKSYINLISSFLEDTQKEPRRSTLQRVSLQMM